MTALGTKNDVVVRRSEDKFWYYEIKTCIFHQLPERFAKAGAGREGQAIVRARHWASELANGTYASVGELAANAKLNSKVVRNELRLAFLAAT